MASLLETMPLRKPALARGEAALLSLGLTPEEQDQVKVLLASAADPGGAMSPPSPADRASSASAVLVVERGCATLQLSR